MLTGDGNSGGITVIADLLHLYRGVGAVGCYIGLHTIRNAGYHCRDIPPLAFGERKFFLLEIYRGFSLDVV